MTASPRSLKVLPALRSGTVAAAFVLLAASVASCAGALAQTPARVGVVAAEKKEVSKGADFVGRVDAVEKVEIRARVKGYLQAVKFEEGQAVKVGDPLFEIEPDLFKADVEQAQGALDRAEAVESARRDPAAAGPGAADETGRHRGPARSGRGLRPAGRRRRAQRQGQSLHGQHQSRLRLHRFADRRPHRHDQRDRRQCRRPRQRRADDHRQPGPDVCDLPGQPARFPAGERATPTPASRTSRCDAQLRRRLALRPRPAGSISSM